MDGSEDYRLNASCPFMRAEIRINDLPVVEFEDGGSITGSLVNHWLVDGSNTLRLDADVDSRHSGVLHPVDIQVTFGAQELFHVRLPEDDQVPRLPYTREWSFDPRTRFGRWTWQDAPVLTLTAVEIAGVNRCLRELHGALASSDVDRTVQLLALKNAEMARAFGRAEARATEGQRSFFSSLFSEENWSTEPLHTEQLDYRLYAHGRVVKPLLSNGTEPIRSVMDEEGFDFSLPVFISNIANDWRIVR